MKVRVTNTTLSTPKGESINGKIFDAEKEGRLYTISARDLHKINPDAFNPNYGEYHFYPNEIEVLSESAHEKFKAGDKVRFKKEFYKEEYFKGLTREKRKRAADIASLGEFDVFCKDRCRVHVTDKFKVRHNIDASLLELCKEPEVKEVKRIAKVGEWIKIVHALYDSRTTKEDYVDGDIIQVESLYFDVVGIIVKGKQGKSVYASHREYVVLENYSPEEKPSEHPKRKWTEEEIVKAKCFLAEELVNGKCKFTFDINNNETTCYNFESNKIKSAKCAYNDECNRYIGAVVAYCKVSGVKIPEFIKQLTNSNLT
jgi:hypothetical protein